MSKSWLTALVATSALVSTPARAVDVNASEAARLTSVFQAYVGKPAPGEPGAVTVVPDGESYKVTFDFARLSRAFEGPKFKLDLGPFVAQLAPLADGTWKVSQTSLPTIAYKIGDESGAVKAEGVTFDGVYDPAIGGYRTATAKVTALRSEAASPVVKSTVSVDGIEQTITGKPGVNGTVDAKLGSSNGKVVQTFNFDSSGQDKPGPMPKFTGELTYTGQSSDIDLKGLHATQILDLWTFLVANPSREQLADNQDALEAKLLALLPLFDLLKGTASVRDVSIKTPFGQGSLSAVAVTVAMAPTSPSSSFELSETFENLKVDSAFIPAWVNPLIPTTISFGVAGRDFDVQTGLTRFIQAMDLDAVPPISDEQAKEAMLGFIPKGIVHIDLKPSTIKAPTYSVDWQGALDVSPNRSKIHVDVSATGIDELTRSLQQVKEKGVGELVIGLYAAKALAKPGPNGASTWAIDYEDGGEFLVNGAAVGPKKK